MTESYTLPPAFTAEPLALYGSYDAEIGDTYFPPRPFSVDGRLRPLETVTLPAEGTLSSFTTMGSVTYGQVDLPCKVRILATLASGDYAIGDTCKLEIIPGTDEKPASWRFARA